MTYTFLDGSIITTRVKGKSEASPQAFATVKFNGEIIAGTGRFQGIKGTVTISAKLLRPEKGEIGPKAVGEGTFLYTLPGK